MSLGIEEIKKVLPQRDPFLFVDEIIELNDDSVRAGYTFKADNDVFKGHFPSEPVVPGVLLVECMAQTGAAAL